MGTVDRENFAVTSYTQRKKNAAMIISVRKPPPHLSRGICPIDNYNIIIQLVIPGSPDTL